MMLIAEKPVSMGVVSIKDHSPIISNPKNDNNNTLTFEPVSYTHLTLPTILLV